jgi:2-oxoisovalerate dehydrogenase E1 component
VRARSMSCNGCPTGLSLARKLLNPYRIPFRKLERLYRKRLYEIFVGIVLRVIMMQAMHSGSQTADRRAEVLPYLVRDAHGKPVIPLEETAAVYSFGHLIRSTETLLLDLFSEGLLSGTTHTCIGQEICQMAVVRALNDPDDAVLSNHRNHGHFLTYSGDFVGLVAEIMGRELGVCRGVGGSQHLAFRHFHSNGVQGGMTAIATGLAWARRNRGSRGIVAVCIGDGTLGQGLVYESLNLAATRKLPVLFVVENNGIAQTTPTSDTIGGCIEARGRAFGIATWRCDDADPDFLRQVDTIVEQVRRSGGPGYLVIDTRRLGPHSKGDDLRDVAEMEAIRGRDPLRRIGATLDEHHRVAIESANHEFVAEVRSRAEASPPSLFGNPPKHIFTTAPANCTPAAPAASGGNIRSALNGALRQMLLSDPRVVVLGEDLHDPYGGAFKVTAGLSTEFPDRVISTPICEAGIVGCGIGLALAGMRPIVEIMFADFVTLAMDQICNHAVKFPGMFDGVSVPLVIRTPTGGRRGYGPTHSQNPENLMTAVPGLTVVFPSARHDCGQMLTSATVDWPYPVVFFEHKLLYGATQDTGGYTPIPADDADPAATLFPTLRRGSTKPDLTIVAYGGMVPYVEKIAEDLQEEEIEVEIVVPCLLSPLPQQTLIGALARRPHIAIVEETHLGGGFGAELAATLLENGFKGRLRRIATPPVPIPAARSLESQVILDGPEILRALIPLLQQPV